MCLTIAETYGMTVILPEQAQEFVEGLPIKKFHGIGKVTAARMNDLGIRTGADLKGRSLEFLVRQFGKAGYYYYNIARARDDRAVEANRIRKSIGAENSFAVDLSDTSSILQQLEKIAITLKERIDKHQASGRTITLKIKFSAYQQITRSKTLNLPINDINAIFNEAKALFKTIELNNRSIRLIGISLSNLDNNAKQKVQLSIW